MKKSSVLRKLLCCLLLGALILSVAACAGDTPTPTPNPDPGENGDPTPTPGPGGNDDPGPGGNDDPPSPPAPSVEYGNGGAIAGAGYSLTGSDFACIAFEPNAGEAKSTTADAFITSLREASISEFQPYVVDGTVEITGTGANYDGKTAVLFADGVTVTGANDVTISNIIFAAPVTVTNSPNVTFDNVMFLSGATSLTVDATANVTIRACRFGGKTGAVVNRPDSTIRDCVFACEEIGLDAAADGISVRNCGFEGTGTGLRVTGDNFSVMYSTFKMDKAATALLFNGSLNGIAAMNVMQDAQTSVALRNADNTVVVRNSLVSVDDQNGKHIYVCDNEMGGRFTGDGTNYLLADGNVYPSDELDHTAVQTNLRNTNGDTLMDVDARLAVGADEALLPHVDRDQFVGMTRFKTVKDVDVATSASLQSYVASQATKKDVIFVAPGAYEITSGISLSNQHANTTVYAYGVYAEYQPMALDTMVNLNGVKNVTFKGITFAHKMQSCGQVYVLEKLTGNRVKVITGAGMMNEFGTTNTEFYNTTGMGAQHPGTFYAWCDTNFNGIIKNSDGTMTLDLSGALYNSVMPGEVFTCRGARGGAGGVVSNSSGVTFKDVTMYGGACGVAFYESSNASTVTYYRVFNSTKSGVIIDEATYNRYKDLEDKYDISLEISVDEQGRFRGSPAHIGSVDATHVIACAVGSTAISCLFENMCDDGTNQHAHHGKLAGYKDNGDGTTTITYKQNLSQFYYSVGTTTPNGCCASFDVGHRIFIYTKDGRLICDTNVLTATVSAGTGTFGGGTYQKYKVTVPTADFHPEGLVGFNLDDDSHLDANKVLVDNMSRQSNGFTFDNTVVRNIRSRALLIKASDGKIVNCTFQHIGMSCAAILYELWWGESGVTEHLEVGRNLFDHTGYFKNQDLYAPLSITGLGSSVDELYLLYKDINIHDNVFKNRTTTYAIYVNSAKDVRIANNDLGTVMDDGELINTTIHLNGAMNIEISDNTYPEDAELDTSIVCQHIKHIFGTDVTEDGEPIFPDKA